jgi:hypothetical protein
MNRKLIRKMLLEALDPADIDLLKNAADESARTKVYRKLAAKYHPDRGGELSDMQELNDMKERLDNPSGTRSQEYTHPDDVASGMSGSGDGFPWDTNPKMPNEFSEEELKAKIFDAVTIGGAYGFSELYVEFLRRKGGQAAKISLERYNKVNMSTFSEPEDILKKENNIAHFKIVSGQEKGNRVSFDCVYKSLRMLQETTRILTSDGHGGLSKALRAYKIGAKYSPLKTTAKGRREIQESIEAFEEIVTKMSFLKRLKYMWLGAKSSEKEEMRRLINKVSSLNSVEGFHYTLYHLILK